MEALRDFPIESLISEIGKITEPRNQGYKTSFGCGFRD
ncbi:hypothetical protein HS1_001778 [Candidatus Desulfofervidus auxilii]|uniref:Uncharacterized protein n=1 Tax=Desulfofervidus auxilii TaxID=1621989 RepID=A0A7U4QLI9_DESA2|nr:hypothetical protein HS1_001778 [Candidatus Desulfofervidus auxilii]